MGKKKITKNNTKSKEQRYYGVKVNDVIYYYDEYDYGAIQGLLLMKKVMKENEERHGSN